MGLTKYFPSPSIFFKYFDNHPYVSYRGEEIKVAISDDLKGIDLANLQNAKGFILQVSDDETQFVLTNVMDGGEF